MYKRGGVWWVRIAGVRRSTGCRDKEAATLTLKRWERELADPSHAAETKETVHAAAVRFLAELRRSKAAAGTVNMYACKVGHVARLLGPLLLRDLTHDTITADYIEPREAEGAAQYTIHRELTALRRILRSAGKADRFHRDVRNVVPSIATGYTPRTRVLTPAEFDAVCAELEPERAAMLCFILGTSARLGEARAYRPGDIGDTAVRLRGTKTARALRTVPVLPLFAAYVDRARARDTDPWTNIRRDIGRACKRAGVPVFTPNDLRRTHATWLVERGAPLHAVAGMLGHASTAMLEKVYGRLNADALGRVLGSL